MFVRYLMAAGLGSMVRLCLDTVDGGGGGGPAGGGGSPASAGDQTTNTGQAADPGGPPAADPGTEPPAGEESLEDLLAGEENLSELPIHEQLRRVNAQNRKLLKRAAKMHGIYGRVKDLDLDSTLEDARAMGRLRDMLREDPDAARRYLGLDASPERTTRTDSRETEAPADLFDLTKLPFDPAETPVNGMFLQLLKTVNALHKGYGELRGQFTQTATTAERQQTETFRREWHSVMNTAAKQIQNEGTRDLFKDAMLHALNAENRKRREGKRYYSPEFLVNHYMRKLGVGQQTQQRAAEAVRQRGAERTARLGPQQTATGTPASARGNQKLNLATARQRMMSLGRT